MLPISMQPWAGSIRMKVAIPAAGPDARSTMAKNSGSSERACSRAQSANSVSLANGP